MNTFDPETTSLLLSFLADLPEKGYTFPQHILSLFLTHLGCKRSLFFPYLGNPVYMEPQRQNHSLGNVITCNIPIQDMRAYTSYYYKLDIISPKLLPLELQHRKVVCIRDIMPLEEYEKTEWHTFMTGTGCYYQACVFLKSDGANLASINLFRAKEEGDFTQREVDIFSFLSDYISAYYLSVLSASPAVRVTAGFSAQFESLSIGVVLLDQNLLVLQANPAARQISRQAVGPEAGQTQVFQRSFQYVSAENLPVQDLINTLYVPHLQDELGRGRVITHGGLTLNGTSFTAMDVLGNMRVFQLVFLTQGAQPDLPRPDTPLTSRENEVLGLILADVDNNGIAETLHMSVYTVRTHISNIYRKYGVKNKFSLLYKLRQGG